MQITVSTRAIKQNFAAVKAAAGGAKICAMVKADAYGHGLLPVAKALHGLADCFGVANDAEAAVLRAGGIFSPVLITGALSPPSAKFLFLKNVIQTVICADDLRLLEHIGTVVGGKVKVHIKIDTGMNRLGVSSAEELEAVIALLNQSKHIECEGIFTHFATGDGSDAEFFDLQHERFESRVALFRAKYSQSVLAHCLASGGVFTAAGYAGDMVRVGLALYGYSPVRDTESTRQPQGGSPPILIPALTATAPVVSVKHVAAGESVSYGRTYSAPEDKTIAVIRAGYGDGYKRILSNRGYCMINGCRAPVVGRVCMDMFMADVSGISVNLGDEAVLIGDGVSAADLAALADTIPYEILTSIKPRIPINYI